MNYIIIVALLLFFGYITYRFWLSDNTETRNRLTPEDISILEERVEFYQRLDDDGRKKFVSYMELLLPSIEITGIDVKVERLDELLVAASGVIPTYGFDNWTVYPNLNEVIIYPDNFSTDYDLKGADRNVLGMVGWQVMEGKMILSKEALRNSFKRNSEKNVGIHEFVHLIDKMDGATDGTPSYLLDNKETAPWLGLLHSEVEKIQEGNSDINKYASKNQAEFLSVVSEYFFQQPHKLQENHPKLYSCLSEIFQQDPESHSR